MAGTGGLPRARILNPDLSGCKRAVCRLPPAVWLPAEFPELVPGLGLPPALAGGPVGWFLRCLSGLFFGLRGVRYGGLLGGLRFYFRFFLLPVQWEARVGRVGAGPGARGVGEAWRSLVFAGALSETRAPDLRRSARCRSREAPKNQRLTSC